MNTNLKNLSCLFFFPQKVAWKVIYGLMEKELDKFMENVPKDIVRQLYEFPNANPKFDDRVIDKEQDTVTVNVLFTHKEERKMVSGRSTNKKNAKRAAAKMALIILKG